MLSKEQLFFLTALSDHLNGRETALPDGLDEDLLLSVSGRQQCEGILYYQTHLPKFQSKFASDSFFAVNRQKILGEIHALFAANHIPYLIFKGPEVAQFYPVPLLRTMGDSDIMVHESDKQKAHELLLSLGLVNDCLGPNEWIYHMGALEFELHHRLMNDEAVSLPEHKSFMRSVWDHTSSEDGIRYHMDWNYHLPFLLLHLRKHFMNSGVGFRQFMDVAVIAKTGTIDWSGFQKTADALEITDFVLICFSFIKKWFGIETPFGTAEITGEFYEQATQQIFNNGVFGFDDEKNRENYTIVQIKKQGRIHTTLSYFFPSYRSISNSPKYAFLKGKPLLLPIAWIYRFAFSLKEGTAKHRVDDVHSHMRMAKEQETGRTEYLKSWGLSFSQAPETKD